MEIIFFKSTSLLFFLLNPLFMSIYLLGFFKSLDRKLFIRVLTRGALIAFVAFCLFALVGDRLLTDYLHSRFLSFQIFGGIVFLIIGIRMVFEGEAALTKWHESPEHISGAIAMPFFIGPGTIMASIMSGAKLPPGIAILSIFVALLATVLCLILLKNLYDHLNTKSERLVQGYINIVGRVMALVVGTFSIEMIISGIESWLAGLKTL